MLQYLLIFRDNLQKKIALWRDTCIFYEKLSSKMACFHVPEVQDLLMPLILNELKNAKPLVR